jgi:hypothetical protein
VFRPDSRQLAARTRTTVLTWDHDVFDDGGEPSLAAPEQQSGELVYGGDFLFLVDEAGAVVSTWPIREVALRDQARRHGGRNLTVQEWRDAFGNAPYRPTFDDLPVDRSHLHELLDATDALDLGPRRAAYSKVSEPFLVHGDPVRLRDVCVRGISADAAAAVLWACERVRDLLPESPDEAERVAEAMIMAGVERAAIIAAVEHFLVLAERRDGADGSSHIKDKKQWLVQLRAGADPRSLYQPPP